MLLFFDECQKESAGICVTLFYPHKFLPTQMSGIFIAKSSSNSNELLPQDTRKQKSTRPNSNLPKTKNNVREHKNTTQQHTKTS
jgi:hypothetical protein